MRGREGKREGGRRVHRNRETDKIKGNKELLIGTDGQTERRIGRIKGRKT